MWQKSGSPWCGCWPLHWPLATSIGMLVLGKCAFETSNFDWSWNSLTSEKYLFPKKERRQKSTSERGGNWDIFQIEYWADLHFLRLCFAGKVWICVSTRGSMIWMVQASATNIWSSRGGGFQRGRRGGWLGCYKNFYVTNLGSLLLDDTGCFFLHWSPKKFKYGKCRLGESTLT